MNDPIEPGTGTGELAVSRLSKDLKNASTQLGPSEVRYLVDLYYQMQEYRIRAQNNVRASVEDGEPNATVRWAFDNFHVTERGIKLALDAYTMSTVPGRWLRSVHGIGPVIAAGMHVYLNAGNPEKCAAHPKPGQIWSYFGLAPGQKRVKGKKSNWNPKAKVLAWKAGESFVKVKGSPKDYYGKFYTIRKDYEQGKNERGDYREQAKETLERVNFGEDTEAKGWYEKGMLPPGHIHARAKRYAVKIFLAHAHHVIYQHVTGEPPREPFVIEYLDHKGYLAPPNWPMREDVG